jgi:HK97 family phage major capsid protein
MPLDGAEEIKTLALELKSASDGVKRIAESTQSEIRNLGQVTNDTKETADKLLLKQNELSARVMELEQRAAAGSMHEPARQKSLGETVADDDGVKALMASGGRGKASVRVKAIVSSLSTDALGSAGDLLMPDRRPGLLPLMFRRLTVRDLITPGRTDTNAIQYVKETGFVNNAATVSETTGALKPQSDIKFDIATTPVTTIAHWMLATRQILSDAPQLQSFIDGRLRLGLAITEENQLLMGTGTGSDLNGIYTQATAYNAATLTIAGATAIDTLRVAMLQASLAEFPATGIVLHPTDWAAITLIKTTDNNYLFSQPQGMVTQTLWGLPVVATTAMTEDKFLVGAFNLGAQLFDRWDADVFISTEDSDNFRKNLVTILAEERLALAVYRPEAFLKGDLGRVA